MLDPACGSGTFLYQTILFKRQRLGQSAKTLKQIEENVVGIDIHPLAVIVAKTTYLLGLGDLLEKRGKAIRIPVYLADSIKPPEERVRRKKANVQETESFRFPSYLVSLNGDDADLPEDLALSDQMYDRAIELCTQYAHSTAGEPLPSEQGLGNFLHRNQHCACGEYGLGAGLVRTIQGPQKENSGKEGHHLGFCSQKHLQAVAPERAVRHRHREPPLAYVQPSGAGCLPRVSERRNNRALPAFGQAT